MTANCGRQSLGLLALVGAMIFVAEAHRPLAKGTTCDHQFSSPADALIVPDISISWSVSRIQTCNGGPEKRAMWMTWENLDPEMPLYIGSGVPTVDRFQWQRQDYLILGPGLDAAAITPEAMTKAKVPSGVQKQIRELNASHPLAAEHGFGGILVQAPDDQSTCDHILSMLVDHCTVRHDRCDFWEPFGGSNSWRVVDQDNHLMPVKGANYHAAVWIRQNTTGKFGVAIGTWAEDFSTDYGDADPAAKDLLPCEADNGDWSEKKTLPEDDPLPYESCEGTPVDELEQPGTAWTGPSHCAACGGGEGEPKSTSCRGACAPTKEEVRRAACGGVCPDTDTEKCIGWAKQGKCEDNKSWMQENCETTCLNPPKKEEGVADDEKSDEKSENVETSGSGRLPGVRFAAPAALASAALAAGYY